MPRAHEPQHKNELQKKMSLQTEPTMTSSKQDPYFADIKIQSRKVLLFNFTDATAARLKRETNDQILRFQIATYNLTNHTMRTDFLEMPTKKRNLLPYSKGLTPGADYEVQVKVSKFQPSSGNYVPFLTKMVKHREVLNKSELKRLMVKAEQYISNWLPVRFAYRNKPCAYFQKIMYESHGIMEVYLKDNNGDPGSPINGKIKGLFFAVRPDPVTGEIPDFSPFGDTRIIIPLMILIPPDFNLYFTDFYCTNSKNIHYVTLVATKHNSLADQFCRTRLPLLNWYTNPFLRVYRYQDTYGFVSCIEPRVELLYTENINLKSPFVEWQYNVRTLGVGYSTEGGLAKRPN